MGRKTTRRDAARILGGPQPFSVSNQLLLKNSASSECLHRWETSVGAKATSSATSLTLRPTSTHSRTSSLRTAESDLVAKSYPCDASSQAGSNPFGSAKASGGIAVSQKKTIRALTRLTKGCATTTPPKTSDNPLKTMEKDYLVRGNVVRVCSKMSEDIGHRGKER